jgi:hypothetical protein
MRIVAGSQVSSDLSAISRICTIRAQGASRVRPIADIRLEARRRLCQTSVCESVTGLAARKIEHRIYFSRTLRVFR